MKQDKDLETNKDKEVVNSTGSQKKATDVLFDKATESFKWWNHLATLNEQDSIGMTLFKISVRIIGVLILIAISPFALVALIVAFMAVL